MNSGRGEQSVTSRLEALARRDVIHTQAEETAEDGDGKRAALTGTVVIPASIVSFDGRTLEVKWWQYDPFLADVSADLFDEWIIEDYSHETGTDTRTEFERGKPNALREDQAYSLRVFIIDNGKRTHIGERNGKRRLCKVLNRGNPSSVEMIVRKVGP